MVKKPLGEQINDSFHDLFRAAGITINNQQIERVRTISEKLGRVLDKEARLAAIEQISAFQTIIIRSFAGVEKDVAPNIFTSQDHAIDRSMRITVSQLLEVARSTRVNIRELIEQDKSHTYIYDMSNEQDIIMFCKECNAVHVTGVLQWFEDNPDTGVEFFAVCSACGAKMADCSEIILDSDLLLCSDCYWIGHCNCCESYVDNTEIVNVNSNEHYGYDYICSDCKEYHDERRADQNIEDLRW